MTVFVRQPDAGETRAIPAGTQCIEVVVTAPGNWRAAQSLAYPSASPSVTFTDVPIGTVRVHIGAYDGIQQGAGGTVQATGNMMASAAKDAQVSADAETQVGAVATNLPASLRVSVANGGQPTINSTDTLQLTAEPMDSDGYVLAVPGFAPTWSVQEAAGGTINAQTGLYTAPGPGGTFTVLATYALDPSNSVTGTIAVTVNTVVKAAVTPKTVSLPLGGTQTFTAGVINVQDASVTWSVAEANGGTIDAQTGAYTAPQAGGTYHVVATSVADPTKSDTATVSVQAGSTGMVITVPGGSAVGTIQ